MVNSMIRKSDVKWKFLLPIICLSFGVYFLLKPSGLDLFAWRTAIIFIATIVCIVLKTLPIGAIGVIAITVYAVTFSGGEPSASASMKSALSAMNNSLIWLIVIAFMIARGFIKTGLGQRVALLLVRIFGKRTLGLAYGLAFADLILAPAMPSNTARCGGVIYPVADSLSRSFNSLPDDISRKKIGTYLISCIGAVNDITSTLFMTGFTANLLAVKLAALQGVTITWLHWFLYFLAPCIISFMITPVVIYYLSPPEIKRTPDAPVQASKKLREMGKISSPEWIMIATVIILLVLWIFGQKLHIDQTATAFIGLSALLLSGVLTWSDVKNEKDAWDTLIWFSALLMLANKLGELGFTSWFGDIIASDVGSSIGGVSWIFILIALSIIYCYLHYFFASGNAIVAALYAVFLSVGIKLGVPPLIMALMLSSATNLSCSLTQYTHARGPILFGAGYIPTGTWWKNGFTMSVVNLIIFFSVGLAWWKITGLY
ncbi:TPA: DASS family sodium-coupled anion symporter [Salmonella enterica]